MAENIQRSSGRPQEYKFDRGGLPAEMGPYIGIVVNNVDNTRSGRLQVWIEQFGKFNQDGSPDLTDNTTWRTVRYITPFYGATQQSGAAGVGTYPGNRNTYGMWFTPPELGTRVLCFFVSGDPSIGGYYVGCIPEDGMNRMIPAIGAVSNYSTNNAGQKQLLADTPAAPVTEINDIDPKFTDDPRFYDKQKPVQSTVEGILFQQGLNKDPVRGPIKSSAQRESPSNCYGISTPGKPIYQGGYSDKTLKTALERGQVKLQDVAVIGRQGGHTLVMDDGDIDGKDTLIRIRTAKGHQITMSDDGDAFYITHANGQTWIELGKAGTVDVYSTNSINLRTQGVLNFHADKGINMYSGGAVRIKSASSLLMESANSLVMSGDKAVLLASKQSVGIRSDNTLGLQGKFVSIKSDSLLNFQAKLINLNGAQTIPVPAAPVLNDYSLADTEFVAGKGWTVTPGKLKTIVTRAPTHEPYAGHGSGADVSVNLNPVTVNIPDPNSGVAATYAKVDATAVQNGVPLDAVAVEPAAVTNVGPLSTAQVTTMTAQTAYNHASNFPAYDDDGNLMPGWELNENNDPVYTGPDLGSAARGVGVYGQKVETLVNAGMLKPGVLSLIDSGISPDLVLKSASSWTGQYGINSIGDFLSAPTLQNIIQVGTMIAAFTGLTNAGVLQGNEAARVVATFVQPATEYGVTQTVQWIDGFGTADEVVNLTVAGRQGQYAVDFADYYTEQIPTANTPLPGTTPERDVIDQAIVDIIDNPKVPIPQYTDTPVEMVNTTETVIQSDGSLSKVDKPLADTAATQADGTITNAFKNATPQYPPQTIRQADGTLINVATPKINVTNPLTTNEDGTLRFAPGSNQG